MEVDAQVKVLEHGHSHDLEDVPCTSGVYAFITSTGAVRYVGHAGPRRLYHEAKHSFYTRKKGRRGDSVVWFVTESKDDARALEARLIADLDPPRNGVELAPRARGLLPGWVWELMRIAWTLAGVIGLAKMLEWAWGIWGERIERWWRAVAGP